MGSFPIRKLRFDWSAMRAADRDRWFGGSPFFSHLVNALSLTFPLGERYFVDAVKRFRGEEALLELEPEVAAFIGQEAHHGRAHEGFNEWLLDGHPDRGRLEGLVEAKLTEMREALSPIEQLAVTCALEHFTATLAELVLEDARLRAQIHPKVLALLEWHAVEETEHKAVAFDVYEALGGDYVTRVRVMAETTVELVSGIARLHRVLMGEYPRGTLSGAVWVALISPGWLRRVGRSYLRYYLPSFHPWDTDPAAHLERARVALEAA